MKEYDPLLRMADGSADVQSVAKWSQDLPDAFILCRDIGHTWRPYRASISPSSNTYNRTLRCGRCQSERRQVIALNGSILSGGYDYPDGYLSPPGSGRINGDGRGALRLESTLRLISKDVK